MAAAAAFGQGQFAFGSTVGGSTDNTITLPNKTTPADSPYQAEVAVGVGTTLASLTLYPASITALSGGYIFGPTFAVTGSAPGATVAFDVLVWNPADGATYAAALAKGGATITGSSGVVQGYVLGGGSPPVAPGFPAFAPFSLSATPEPTTLALGAMGLGALLLRRRK